MPDTTTVDLEDEALNAALTSYNADQKKRALALIAEGQWRKHPESPRAWIIPSASRPAPYIVIVDSGPGYCYAHCPCPATGRCYHGAAAIMLHIHAEHDPTHHSAVSTGIDQPSNLARVPACPGCNDDHAAHAAPISRTIPDPFAGIPNADDTAGDIFRRL